MKTNTNAKTTKLNVNDGQTYRLWNVCLCGCAAIVRNNFKQGHDMRMRTRLTEDSMEASNDDVA